MSENVLHVIGRYMGWTHTFIYNQINNLSNYQPVVFAFREHEPDRFPADFPVIYPSPHKLIQSILLRKAMHPTWGSFRPDSLSLRAIDNLMRHYEPRLIHAHFGPTGVLSLSLKERYHLPLITTFYGKDVSIAANATGKLKHGYQRLFDQSERILVLSNEMATALSEQGADISKVRVQRTGIDVEHFSFRERKLEPAKPMKVLMVSRFTAKKGIDILIASIAHLLHSQNNRIDVSLTLVGDGQLREELKQQVHELRINDYVSFTGTISNCDLPAIYHGHHVFAHPSRTASSGDREGVPTTIMEAMATGMPVISTHHAGIPELVDDPSMGILVDEGDIVGLASGLRHLFDLNERWGKMGLAARKRITENYSQFTQARLLEEHYSKTLNE